MPCEFRDCHFLTGPTASGKTTIGLLVAEEIGAEIVSMDSMAVFRGMNIGTAKPSEQQQRRIAHHLVDLVDPDQEFSVAQYLQAAALSVWQIRARGAIPLFLGGTPLYLKALLRGFFAGPQANWDVRATLLERAKTEGVESLHAELTRVDPLSAARLHPNDVRRVVRALEVFHATGEPISSFQHQFDSHHITQRVFVLDWSREKLHERIHARVAAMLAEGLIEEARHLRETVRLSRTALQAVGYREIFGYLDGALDLQAAIALIETRTRQFAKRQMTWFRSLPECRFVRMDESDAPERIARRIVDHFRKKADLTSSE